MAKFAKFAVAAILVPLFFIAFGESQATLLAALLAVVIVMTPVFCYLFGMREKKSGRIVAVIGSILFWGIFAILIKDCVVGTRTCIGFRSVVGGAIPIWLLSIVPFYNFRWTSIGFDWLGNFTLGIVKIVARWLKLVAGGLNSIAQKGRKSDSEK